MYPFLKLLRPQQWVKNIFVFFPLFFGGHFLEHSAWLASLQTFVSFCFASSGIYCLNDIIDLSADRHHPHKRLRPLASGAITIQQAYLLMSACFVCSFLVLIPGNINIILAATILSYILLNISYCFWLKKMPIIDFFCIAIGFVLRVVAGGIASGIWISEWIVMMTFMLTLLLASSKRRYDILLSSEKDIVTRSSAKHYTTDFLNVIVSIIASVTIVCYIMYTVSPAVTQRTGTNFLYITSLFVIASIFRYLYQSVVKPDEGSDPTHILLHDRFIQVNILLWIISFVIIIYF